MIEEVKKLTQKASNFLAGTKVLECQFGFGVIGDSFEKSFFALPVGYMCIKVQSWDRIRSKVQNDHVYGTGQSRMFNRIRDLVNLRHQGVVSVTVRPYKGKKLQKYYDATWDGPKCW